MDEASKLSCEAYRKVVFSDKNFIEYFRIATPEQELGRLCIGSRPAKRKKGGGVETLRAIPWIFAWTQVRLLLPAWLGMEKALENILESESKYKTMKEMIELWPFFHSLMDSIDMVLAKADRKMSGFYDKLLPNITLEQYGKDIRAKLSTIKEINLKIINDLDLSKERDVYRSSLHYRNPYIDPLNLCQVEMISRLNTSNYNSDCEKKSIEDALMLSIAGIAAGLKNTG
jgi:phosphoenolpyruvate carboxylase